MIGNGRQGMLWMSAIVLGLALILALICREAFLALAGALISSIGFLTANHWPLAFTTSWPSIPAGTAGDSYLCVQVLILLSAYAALVLSWSLSLFSLSSILVTTQSGERLVRQAKLCLWPICLGVVLLAASALLDGWRMLEQGPAWRAGNAQMMGTLVVLPGCAALAYAHWRGRMPPFLLLLSVALGFGILALVWHIVLCARNGNLYDSLVYSADAGFYIAGLFALSLATHAALRYYFGRQRILEA